MLGRYARPVTRLGVRTMHDLPQAPSAAPPRDVRIPWLASLSDFLEREHWLTMLPAVVVTAVVMSVVQWATPNIIGVDGYYHIKIADIMRRAGPPMAIAFPWLQLTVLNPASFSDHHFLFHVLLEPFTLFDLRVGAKLAAATFASLAVLAVYLLMSWQGVRWSLAWLLVLLGASPAFLFRISMTRRQSLVLLLMVLLIAVAFARRDRLAAAIGFAFSWVFDGFLLFIILAMVLTIGRRVDDGRWRWGLLGYSIAGTLLGLVIHPYTPRSITFALEHALPKLQPVGNFVINVGNEWYPYAPNVLLRVAWPALAAVALGFVPLVLCLRFDRRWDGRVIALGLLAVFFTLLLIRSRRFIEYQPAFAVLFCAFAWSHQLPRVMRDRCRRLPRRATLVALTAALVVGAMLLRFSVPSAQGSARTSRPHDFYAGAARWLVSNTPLGSRVFTTDWDDFPLIFFQDAHNTYLIGLDPTYMYQYDPNLYLLWRAITRGQREAPGALIQDVFGSRYLLTDLAHEAFIEVAARDPRLRRVYRDGTSEVYEVIPVSSPTGGQ